jgi:hypothetical protein
VIIYKGKLAIIGKQLLEIRLASILGLDLLGWAVFAVVLLVIFVVVKFFNIHLIVKVIDNFI